MEVLARAGCREVIAAPLLLFEAGHAKRDVPEAVREAARERGIRVSQADPLGCHPDMVALARQRRVEALAAAGGRPEETALVMVGRGSSDPAALDQLVTFTSATLAHAATFQRVLYGFVAAARPTLAEALQEASDPADAGVRMVMVQPHLLFRGHVENQVAAAIDAGRAKRPDLAWVHVARLGADPLVAKALVARTLDQAAEVGVKTVSPNRA
jgi:sirohydrochlorin ferrochelatase